MDPVRRWCRVGLREAEDVPCKFLSLYVEVCLNTLGELGDLGGRCGVAFGRCGLRCRGGNGRADYEKQRNELHLDARTGYQWNNEGFVLPKE
jgi:hypothetical protein